MNRKTNIVLPTEFEKEVYEGLTHSPKHLSSKYIYDSYGDKLFQEIMDMPVYYLTNAEHQIFNSHKEEISNLFQSGNDKFKLIELGAGDGRKTKILLEHLTRNNVNFKYQPIDISHSVLAQLEASIRREIPEVCIEPLQGTYFEILNRINIENGTKKIILFLGSNIGNLTHELAIGFLNHVRDFMHDDDLLFVGFDQKKNPETVLKAYNDPAGITSDFNKNILARINRELDADIDLDQFLHWEVYDPESGTAKSYLVSKKEQSVTIKKLDLTINFNAWETIHTEISQKYDDQTVQWLAEASGFQIEKKFVDTKGYYKNYVFAIKNELRSNHP
ncbi:L-histidine N(alpha)-methyltransferase [Maribacter polysiphoniae]|uniref:L-histidine N(alpha)-methyltransferase n=1 Tax=Maribacter polysiphoniae TaxID=429344 RepID=UPI002357A753|nr:L-histidine N(alpha)-methyltransferase [Maribacter polysiphoniae]